MRGFEQPIYNLAAFGEAMREHKNITWTWDPLGKYHEQFAFSIVETAQCLADPIRDAAYDIKISRGVIRSQLQRLSWKSEVIAGIPFPRFTRSLPEFHRREDIDLICDSLLATTIVYRGDSRNRYLQWLICHGLEWCCSRCQIRGLISQEWWISPPLLDLERVRQAIAELNTRFQ